MMRETVSGTTDPTDPIGSLTAIIKQAAYSSKDKGDGKWREEGMFVI
jgi:hypothetical protein